MFWFFWLLKLHFATCHFCEHDIEEKKINFPQLHYAKQNESTKCVTKSFSFCKKIYLKSLIFSKQSSFIKLDQEQLTQMWFGLILFNLILNWLSSCKTDDVKCRSRTISRICSNLKSGSSFLKLHSFLSDGNAFKALCT